MRIVNKYLLMKYISKITVHVDLRETSGSTTATLLSILLKAAENDVSA